MPFLCLTLNVRAATGSSHSSGRNSRPHSPVAERYRRLTGIHAPEAGEELVRIGLRACKADASQPTVFAAVETAVEVALRRIGGVPT
jgi:hypothetical protein